MSDHHHTPPSSWQLLRTFLTILVPLSLLLLIVAFIHYKANQSTERITREASETLNVELARRTINQDIGNVISDLMFLAEHIEKQALFDAGSQRFRDSVAMEFIVLAEKKHVYDQLRFLDTNGLETVRINYRQGRAENVPQQLLQNKLDRYYFRDALKTGKGELYMSPFDLNVEDGVIEQPLKPMLRFATPVFDQDGQKRGLVFINYSGKELINNFKRVAANISDHIQLVNTEGYWLSSPVAEDEWGFMLNNGRSFSAALPTIWQTISRINEGQFTTRNGLFTYSTLYPATTAESALQPGFSPDTPSEVLTSTPLRYWKVIAHISPTVLDEVSRSFLQRNLLIYVPFLFFIIVASVFLSYLYVRHRYAEAQSEYERRFRNTLEDIQLAAVTLNRDGNITFCNDFFLHLTGWRRGELLGKNWYQTFIPEAQRQQLQQLLSLMDTPDSFPSTRETEILASNGDHLLIAWSITLLYDRNDKATSMTAIGEDITEQRRNQIELMKLSTTVEQSPSVVTITNTDGIIEYVNPKFTALTGYSLDEVTGKPSNILKSGETDEAEYQNLWHTISTGGEWRGEFHNRKKSGELYWEAAAISPIRDAGGNITHYLAVKEDITERKRLESEVEERNRELANAQVLAVLGRMSSMIAHDLRNPLSSIKMTLQILSKLKDIQSDENANEMCTIARDQVRYMENILADMLAYSRPDALKPEWINIDKTIDAAINLVQKKISDSDLSITTRYQPGLPTVHIDDTKIRQVISNLLSNAVDASQDVAEGQDHIVIQTQLLLDSDGPRVKVSICDHGHGIPKEKLDHVFEPFYTSNAKGTGLGLAIVKRIIEQHAGEVVLEPNNGGGTCAAFTLPTEPISNEETGKHRV